jgi:hypothetical protein
MRTRDLLDAITHDDVISSEPKRALKSREDET